MKDKSIGRQLYLARNENGYSIDYVASKTGIPRQVLAEIETNITPIELGQFIKLCRLYDVSADYLIKQGAEDDTQNL